MSISNSEDALIIKEFPEMSLGVCHTPVSLLGVVLFHLCTLSSLLVISLVAVEINDFYCTQKTVADGEALKIKQEPSAQS